MAQVKVPLKAFVDSELPGICVFTGRTADEMFRFRFGKVVGGLPVSAAGKANLAKLRLVVLVLFAIALGGMLLGVLSQSGALSWAGIGMMFMSVVATLFVRKRLVQGVVTGDDLVLSNVHDVFAHTIDGPPPGKCKDCPSKHECPSAAE